MIPRLLHALVLAIAALSIASIPIHVAKAEDPPTEFSKQVTAITGDWEAEDWRKGILVLHPKMYTWQSDQYLNLFAEEPVNGRSALEVARGHFDGDSLGDDTLDPTLINMSGATELAPGILAVRYNWSYAFDDNVSFYGVVTTAANSYVPFHANCERDDPKFPEEYSFDKCARSLLTLLLFVKGGQETNNNRLVLPETQAPINIAGWDSSYLKDGTSLSTNGSSNGLRKVLLYVTPPRAIPPDKIAPALKQFSDGIIHDDDDADENLGSIRVVGTHEDPWLRREFPEAFEGPSIQMAGTQFTADGKVSFIGIRCPNSGWLKTCAYGVEQAKAQIKSGQMEARRQRYIAARQTPIPANGIKNAQVLGVYGTGEFDGSSFIIDGHLYLKDGSVYRSFDKAPALIDMAASRQSEASDWGKWRRSGNSMIITWGDGETETKSASADEFFVGGTSATRISGHYSTVSSGGGFTPGSGWVSRASYTFSADGTFQNDRSNSFSVGGYVPGEVAPVTLAAGGGSSSTGKARYEIDGHMISFFYPSGEIERESFAIYAKDVNNMKRKYVLIGGTPYTLDEE
jgi:hypothetical protein